MASDKQILRVLELLAGVYGQEPDNVSGYLWALRDFEADDLDRAARLHLKKSKWFPKPAELVALAQEYSNQRKEYWHYQDLNNQTLRGEFNGDWLDNDTTWQSKYRPPVRAAMPEHDEATDGVVQGD